MPDHVLAGDIGGTHARFALFSVEEAPRLVHHGVLESRAFTTFGAALRAFLDDNRPRDGRPPFVLPSELRATRRRFSPAAFRLHRWRPRAGAPGGGSAPAA